MPVLGKGASDPKRKKTQTSTPVLEKEMGDGNWAFTVSLLIGS